MGRRAFGSVTALVLALSSIFLLGASAASAVTATDCETGTYPATQGSQSNFRIRCVIDDSDSGTKIVLHDYDFAGYHRGAARNVSVKTNASTGQLIGATNAFSSADLGRTVTANATAKTCTDIKPRSFITAVSGTTTATVFPKPGKTTSTTRSVASVTSYAGRNFIAITAGSATFTACDVGRTITAGPGGTVNKKITTFVNSKLVVISAAATSNATATATLSAVAWPVQVGNSRSRSFVDAASTLSGTSLTSAVAKFAAGDVNAEIDGTCIAPGTYIVSVAGTTATLSNAAACTPAAGAPERTYSIASAGTIGNPGSPSNHGMMSHAREINCTVVTAPLRCNSTGANFHATDVGLAIKCGSQTGKITSIVNPDSAVITAISAGTKNGCLVGVPTGTAPTNGTVAMQLATLINLKPSLVAGSDPCSADTYEGTTIAAEWYNPGSYVTAGILGATGVRPNNSIAELLFPTSVTSFAAFVIQEDGDTQEADAHYDVVFPLLPTTLAICDVAAGATTAIDVGTSWVVFGTTNGTQKLPTGWGQPGTALVRGVKPLTADATDTATVTLFPDPGGDPDGTDVAGTSCTIDVTFAFTNLAAAEACGY
jgi:hypothetical protein